MKIYDKQYINGEWRVGTGKGKLQNYNPYTGELLYEYQPAGIRDVDDAYAAARAAQKKWGRTLPTQRRDYLGRLSSALLEMKDEIFEVLVKEGGSTQGKAGVEFFAALEILSEAKSFPEHSCGRIIPSNVPGKENHIIREPLGVIGVITSWSMPLLLAMRSVVPAVATGNTVVLKPSSLTPATGFLIASLFESAGFPRGVFNAIAGRGSKIGEAMVKHPVPSLISFTGSTAVGSRVASIAAAQIKEVALGLSGNNVMIVLPDADLAAAAKAAAYGAFFNSGQACMALNRILIHESRYDEFVEILRRMMTHATAGDPTIAGIAIGPMINSEHVKRVEDLINDTIESGAKVVIRGKTVGNLIFPWVLSEVTNDMPAAKGEVFGPVVSLIRYKSEDEAIDLANATEYGLIGSVFTEDLFRGIEVARQIECGMVHVNDQSINDEPHVMFGGMKCSGFDRLNGVWAADKFTRERWISVQTKPRQWPV